MYGIKKKLNLILKIWISRAFQWPKSGPNSLLRHGGTMKYISIDSEFAQHIYRTNFKNYVTLEKKIFKIKIFYMLFQWDSFLAIPGIPDIIQLWNFVRWVRAQNLTFEPKIKFLACLIANIVNLHF